MAETEHRDGRSAGPGPELRQDEPSLRAAMERFEQLAETIELVLWVHELVPVDRISYVSPAFERIWGRPAQAFRDNPALWLETIHAEDRPRVEAAHSQSVRDPGGTEFRVEYRIVRGDGSVRWIADCGRSWRDGHDVVYRLTGAAEDITARRLADQGVRESEQHSRALIDSLKQAEASLRDERDRLDSMARAAPSILHTYRRAADGRVSFPYGSERIAGLYEVPLEDLQRDGAVVRGRMDASSRARVARTTEESARTLQPWLAQFRIDTPTRGEVWIEGHSMPVAEEDGSIQWHGSLTDITQRKAAEEALADSQRQLQSLFDHLGDGLITLTPRGRLLQWNPVALRMHGFDGSEDLSSVDHASFDPFELYTLEGEFVPKTDWPLARIVRGETLQDAEYRVRHRVQGWERVLAYSGSLVHGSGGEPILSILQLRDTTEQRRKDDELHQLTQRLEDRVRERTIELESAISELEAFSYSVSHDLRAPLRAMDGFSQLLMRDHAAQLGSEGSRYLGLIHHSARKMGRLIEDLLAFARLSRQPLRTRPVETDVLVREVIHQLQPMQQGRDIEWRIGDLPPCAGDLPMLRQVWINLLSNALKYSRPREHAVIEIGSIGDAAQPTYFVSDNGMGFDMAFVHRLFGVFQRLHRDEDFEGTGVGLALVRRIVLRHGGEVRAEGRPGQGATFTFSLGAPGETPDTRRGL